jgi:ferredoxin
MRHALDVAREAMRAGAKEIRVVCLESWEEMPATAFEKEEAVREGIKFFNRLGPRRILGASGRVTGLETLRVTRVFDEAGRFSPQFAEGSESVMECDSVILAVGQTSDLSWIQPEDGIAVTPRGTVQVDSNTLATTAPGVYAGGDAAFGPRIFIEGVANGHRAALSIHQYLTGERPAEQQRGLWRALDVWQEFFSEDPVRGPALPIRRRDYFRTPRHEPPALPIDRRIGIAEVELGYEPGQAAKQGARCLKCGINVIFDGSRCILCGGCVDICPGHCLRMVPVERLAPTRPLAALVERRYGVPAADIPVGSGTAMLMDATKCIRCGLCALRCPTGTITLEQFTFSEGWAATPTE